MTVTLATHTMIAQSSAGLALRHRPASSFRTFRYVNTTVLTVVEHALNFVPIVKKAKTAQIQIRISSQAKAELMRRARASGMDLTGWMLARLLPDEGLRLRGLLRDLATGEDPTFVLAELGSFLSSLGKSAFAAALELPPDARLDELRANQVAAMIETVAERLGVRPPQWVEEIPALPAPWFASNLTSVRLHLLTRSPPAFRRRNLFVDSTLGDRA